MQTVAFSGDPAVYAVMPETDEEHLRLRAWWCAKICQLSGKPLSQHHALKLIIQGGKIAEAVERINAPTAA